MEAPEVIGVTIGFLSLLATLVSVGGGVWWKLARGEEKLDNLCEKMDDTRREMREEHRRLWDKSSEHSLRNDEISERLSRLEVRFSLGK